MVITFRIDQKLIVPQRLTFIYPQNLLSLSSVCLLSVTKQKQCQSLSGSEANIPPNLCLFFVPLAI